jgi:selenocysteine lyase/cysteine desulfurase
MNLTRRELLLAAGSLPLAAKALGAAPADAPAAPAAAALPFKAGFFAPTDITYLDSGSQHPILLGARAAIEKYLDKRALDPAAADYELDTEGLLGKYARLVNADVDEVAFVQSTTTAEQMFLRALGLPKAGGHIVTDTLHFFGSLPLYAEMEKRGVKVTWVRDRDGRIPLEDMEKAIRPGTKLVALSLVSTINGFAHDLKAVCDLAHAAGARVYADIIHAAGCMPLDLHASGVDFAAGASYKWLMGDFGLGFLYARRDRQPELKRSNYGYYGMSTFQSHIYPFDPPGDTIVDYAFQDNATGHFALGTHSHTVPALLHHSLDYLLATGVTNIQAHAQTLIGRLKEELPQRGFKLITPAESGAPIVACALENARERLGPQLQAAKVRITLSKNRFRITPSVFNDIADIERLLAALGRG